MAISLDPSVLSWKCVGVQKRMNPMLSNPAGFPDLLSEYPLTLGQINQFRSEGFVILRNVLTEEEVEPYWQQLQRVTQELNEEKRLLKDRDSYGRSLSSDVEPPAAQPRRNEAGDKAKDREDMRPMRFRSLGRTACEWLASGPPFNHAMKTCAGGPGKRRVSTPRRYQAEFTGASVSFARLGGRIGPFKLTSKRGGRIEERMKREAV